MNFFGAIIKRTLHSYNILHNHFAEILAVVYIQEDNLQFLDKVEAHSIQDSQDIRFWQL